MELVQKRVEGTLNLVEKVENPSPITAPIISSYNDRIRPVLDAIDKLRNLNIVEEGIELPTIVVVGDQSSGKSSVLESLAEISLPRGQGICTRVPLLMRLQNNSSLKQELFLEYNGKLVPTDEEHVSEAINLATNEIAGDGKRISNSPLTLTVKKRGVPDLTMVDLPGITRVAVSGQPDNIYDQIRDIIMEYIKPEASIILNVLAATVDFPTCESIRMSQSVDKTGERTLAVVTKSDKAPEGLKEKVTSDDVNIGLGYVCVRNRIGDESYEEARVKEANLFASHPLLSKIEKSIVGIPILAQKLMAIQAKSIARNLPDIVRKTNVKLSHNLVEFNMLPKTMSSVAEALTAFMRIVGQVKESLQNILLRGEFDEYPDDKRMHCTARLAEMLGEYSDALNKHDNSFESKDFLSEEIKDLEEARRISLPNYLPQAVFLTILGRKVDGVSSIPEAFVTRVWDYIEEVLLRVLTRHVDDYHHLKISARGAVLGVVDKMKCRSMKWVGEMVQMEKMTDYTCDPGFEIQWSELMKEKVAFLGFIERRETPSVVRLGRFCDVNVEHLWDRSKLVSQAFDLRMRMVAYWEIVLRRLVDTVALHLRLSMDNLVRSELESCIVRELMGPTGGGIERLMEESPSVAVKRGRLDASIKKLKDCKQILGQIMDTVTD